MRFERAAASVRGALADLPVPPGQHAQERVVPLRAVRIGSRLHVDAVRVQVRGVRTVRHIRGAGQAARVHECGGNVVQDLVEVLEHPRRRRGAVAPLGLRDGTKSGIEIVRRNLERVRRWPFRHLPVIRAEHVSQLHAENGITPRANRRTRTGAVEAEERREPVARRDRPRDVPVSNDLQRQRLARPLLRTPYPRLRPVLDAHCRWIRERIRRRRLRRSLSLSLSRSGRLQACDRGRRVGRAYRREPRPHLQQFATRQQARLARLVVLFHLDVSGEVGSTVTETDQARPENLSC